MTEKEEHKKTTIHHHAHKHKVKKTSIWKTATIIVGILFIISLYYNLSDKQAAALTPDEASEKALSYINQNLLRGQATATVESITEKNGMYSIQLSIGGRKFDSYLTTDGKLLFPQAINLEQVPEQPAETEAPSNEYPKSDKPEVKLFVMSQCPYGTIAEKAMEPVVDTLKDKADIKLYFIANDNNDGTFKSLHGQPEVDGDIRQLCIDKYYSNEVFFNYLVCVAEDYKNLGSIWEKCAADNGIDTKKIKTCQEGNEGTALLAENVKEAAKYSVSGSPTLIINDRKYNGARTPEAYKGAICSAFNEAPDECGDTLSTEGAAATGGCG